jgi:exosome complex RNA-binding protein Csl4
MALFVERIVVPGDHLGSSATHRPGDGTFERDGQIYAAVVGNARLSVALLAANMLQINVFRVDDRPTIVPKLGDVVLGKVPLPIVIERKATFFTFR